MYIFGQPVGTAPKPVVLRNQRVALWFVYCHLWNLEHDGSVFEDYTRRDDTRQLIHLLSVSGT